MKLCCQGSTNVDCLLDVLPFGSLDRQTCHSLPLAYNIFLYNIYMDIWK